MGHKYSVFRSVPSVYLVTTVEGSSIVNSEFRHNKVFVWRRSKHIYVFPFPCGIPIWLF